MRARGVVVLAVLAAVVLLGRPAGCQEAGVEDEAEDAAEDRAFLIARKFVKRSAGGEALVKGRNETVVIELFNAGTSAAYDVTVKDEPMPGFQAGGGQLTTIIPRLATGATAKLEHYVIPLADGMGMGPAAHITYRTSADATAIQEAFTTQAPLMVLTPFQMTMKKMLLAGAYATGGALSTAGHWQVAALVLAAVGLGLGGNWAFSTVSDARKRRKYERALEEVQKMK